MSTDKFKAGATSERPEEPAQWDTGLVIPASNRALFEHWVRVNHKWHSLKRKNRREYVDPATRLAWEVWKNFTDPATSDATSEPHPPMRDCPCPDCRPSFDDSATSDATSKVVNQHGQTVDINLGADHG